MHHMAPHREMPVFEDRRLAAELEAITAIYSRLYADRAVRLVLYEGHDLLWSAPSIVEHPVTLRPEHLSPEYLGCIDLPGPLPESAIVTVFISVPRRPTPLETGETHGVWRPQSRLAPAFALVPLWYEELRYIHEMKRKMAAQGAHSTTALLRGRGVPGLSRPRPPVADKRPAILIGMHWLEVGGAEKLGFDCVQWALEAGLRVFVMASVLCQHRLAHKLGDHPDVTFLRLDRYLPREHWGRFVEQLVIEENIRLIHIHHCVPLYDMLPHLRVVAPWLRVIDSTHIIEYQDGGYPRIAGVWSNYIDVLHVISRELVDYFRDTFRLVGKVRLGRMLTRAPGGVQLPPVTFQPGQKTLHVTFIGRYFYQKRPIVVVEMLRALNAWAVARGITLTGTMVGEGPFEAAVRRLLARHGLSAKIEMRAAGTDVPALLRRSDILLLPSNNEGLALVCYEAVEHGCIPLSTDVGSQREIVPAELLLPLSPRKGVKTAVAIVDRLWRDADFLLRQQEALHAAFNRLMADPTAQEVMMPIYRDAALTGAKTGDGTRA